MPTDDDHAPDEVTVRDNPTESRYEIRIGDALAGFATYQLHGDRISFTHTEVDPAHTGRGLASRLVTHALDDARARGLAVLPFCPYVRAFLTRNPAYRDLVPAHDHPRFGL